MTAEELTPFLGAHCHLRLRCRGCGTNHVLTGTPRLGRHPGDFVLKDLTFDLEDIEQVWKHQQPPRGKRIHRPLVAREVEDGAAL